MTATALQLPTARTRDTGYADGLAAGLREAEARADRDRAAFAAEQDAWRQAAEATAAQQRDLASAAAAALHAKVASSVEDAAETVVAAALTVATAVIGREVSAATTAQAQETVRRVVAQVNHAELVGVRVHPDDYALLQNTDTPAIADPSLARGDVVVDLVDGYLDATIATITAHVAAALREDAR